jgi:cold shock CspA family protein
MSRSQETFNKKEVRNKKEKKRKEKAAKRQARREGEKSSMDDMIAYVDENGMITDKPIEPGKKKSVKLEDIEISVPKGNLKDEADLIKKGTVTFYNESKGFGFIRDLESKQNVFFHTNNVMGEVKEGNLVTFEMEMGQRGLNAVKVQISK